MQGVLSGKLRQDVSKLQKAQMVSADQIRKLEIEKVALEMDKEVLEKEKEELQKQVLAAGKQGDGGMSAAHWREVAEFWANMGAKLMVRNAMCSPELKEWLLGFATRCTDIGYTEGVTAVFTANQQKEEAAKFPYYEEGDTDGPLFIDGQIAELQSGLLEFEFLRYIEANPGLSSQDLATVFEHVYLEAEQGGHEPTGEVPPEAADEVPLAGDNKGEAVGTPGQVTPEVEAKGAATLGEEPVEEDLRDAKEV